MTRFILVLLVLGIGACRTPIPTADVAEVTIPGPEAASFVLADPESTSLPSAGEGIIISLSPGFAPSPYRATGDGGGRVDGSSLGPGCIGFITQAPNFQLEAQGSFAQLSIVAASARDITLLVERPDGTYLCNDDTEGLNPAVRGSFPAGTYKIWVGTYEGTNDTPFRLGISERAGFMPSAI